MEEQKALQPEVILTLTEGLVALAIIIGVAVVVVALLVEDMVMVIGGVMVFRVAAAAVDLAAQVLMPLITVVIAEMGARLQLLLPEVRLFFLIIDTLSHLLHIQDKMVKGIAMN